MRNALCGQLVQVSFVSLVLGCSGSNANSGAEGNHAAGGETTLGGSSPLNAESGGRVTSGGEQAVTSGSGNHSGGTHASGGQSTTASGVTTGGIRATGGTHSNAAGGASNGTSSTGTKAATGGVAASGGAATTGGSITAGGTLSTGGVKATGTSSTGGNAAGGRSASGGATAAGGTSAGGSTASNTGPCDIYKAGNTPCVAAYSTTRALYGSYSGNLYQVKKADGTTKNITAVAAGGVADAAIQDAFCTGSGSCTISIIYDQSGNGNDLTKAPGGSKDYGPNPDVEAVADALPIKLGGHKVYGVHVVGSSSWTSPGQVGYRNTATKNIPKGDNPETEYMVTDGTYYNGSCCFDFGNAEMQPVAGGYGTMEAIYFGSCDWWDKGPSGGPWIMADLEVGVYNKGGANAYSDANKNGDKINSNDGPFTYPFVTAMLKGNSSKATSGGPFTLKGGNAQSGALTTVWDGAYPVGYGSPMQRQGGIVLGIGGDNSSMAHGNFFEGIMTAGYASPATDDAIQANIVAAGYSK